MTIAVAFLYVQQNLNQATQGAHKRIGIVVFDGVAALDFVGPLEIFASARLDNAKQESNSCYEVLLFAVSSKTITSEAGLTCKAHRTISEAPQVDTIIVPGGSGLRRCGTGEKIATWVNSCKEHTKRVATVSTGIYGVAPSGLLNGRLVTTHWRALHDVAKNFPKLLVNSTASFLKDECFYTSGGGISGMEMTLALIHEDYGARVALAIAREFLLELRPAGDEECRLDPSSYQSSPAERLGDLPAWILTHLERNLTVDLLARRTGFSVSHFKRLFNRTFNSTPRDFVERLRLNEARRRLVLPRENIKSVAAAVGFKSCDVFRRVFEKRQGMSPRAFRSRFQPRSAMHE